MDIEFGARKRRIALNGPSCQSRCEEHTVDCYGIHCLAAEPWGFQKGSPRENKSEKCGHCVSTK